MKKEDILRADCSENYDLPPCPICGGKMYVEHLVEFRVAHFCKGLPRRQVKTAYCETPDEAVSRFINGEYREVML